MDTDKPVVIISRGVKPQPSGIKSAKEYPYWDDLIQLLEKHYTVQEVVHEPFDKLEKMLKSAHAVICCDSFLQHFCWTIGVKAIVLWGTSDPAIFGHKENVNLLKHRSYIRKNPFDDWNSEVHNPNAFVTPQEILLYMPRK